MGMIEYFYSTHSAFAYIGSRLLINIAKRRRCRIVHRPIDLRITVNELSGEAFGHRSEAHRAYFFDREIERWAKYRHAPLINHRPTWHDEPLDLPNGFVIAAQQRGINVDELAHEILKAHWLEDANHADPDTLMTISAKLGIDGKPLVDQALTEEIQTMHRANTREAVERSVFGSPTYFHNGDMFYGQDHLELLERAIQQPFSGIWPKSP